MYIRNQNITDLNNTSQLFFNDNSKNFAIQDSEHKEFINNSTLSKQDYNTQSFDYQLDQLIQNELTKVNHNEDLGCCLPNLEIPTEIKLNIRGEYTKKKFHAVALAFFELSKIQFAKNKNNQDFSSTCIDQIVSIAGCSRRTAVTHIKTMEQMRLITVTRSKARKVGNNKIRAARNAYSINFELLYKFLLDQGLVKKPTKRNLHSNKYKEEIIINSSDIFYLNGKKIQKEEVQPEKFIQKYIYDLILVAQKSHQKIKLKYLQVRFIIKTFLKVVGNSLKDNQELIRMILGWIKNRYNQLVLGHKLNGYSMWLEADDHIDCNGHKLCDNYVLLAENSIKLEKNATKIANNSVLIGWIPSRNLIYNKSQQVKNLVKHKISEATFFKILGAMMITSKLRNLYRDESLL